MTDQPCSDIQTASFGPHGAHYATLSFLCEILDDLERTRIANENRVRSLTQDGAGYAEQTATLAGIVAGLAALEHDAELALIRAMRVHPLGPWVKATIGVGLKQGARLLGAIGDPYWNAKDNRPRRGPQELNAYCGYHNVPADQSVRDAQAPNVVGDADSGPDQTAPDAHAGVVWAAARRRKGQRSNWNADAKMRAFLIAESCMKQSRSPYRDVYDKRKANTAGKLHDRICPQCGGKGPAAPIGSPWRDGHRHVDALRVVAKEILKDLWRESKRAHAAT